MSTVTVTVTPVGVTEERPPVKLAADTALFELVELSHREGPLEALANVMCTPGGTCSGCTACGACHGPEFEEVA